MKLTKRILAVFFIILMVLLNIIPICNAEQKLDVVERFDGKRIGVQTGTIYASTVSEIFPNSDIYYFSTLPDAIAAITKNKIDAIYADLPVMRYCISQVEGVDCEPYGESNDYLAIIASKTNEGKKLITEFNEYLSKIKTSGELDKLTQKWFDGIEEERVMDDFSTLPDTGKKLIIASELTFPPFEYIKNEQPVGFEPEIIYGFCKEYGYSVQYENVAFDGIVAGVNTGKFDLGVSGFSITEERKKQVEFSDIVYTSGAGIAYLNEDTVGGFFNNIIDRFKSSFMVENRWKMFADGLLTTFEISVISIIIGTILGFVVHMLCRKGNPVANGITNFIRLIISGLPVVVLLMILFYIVFGNSALEGKWVAIIGFSLIFACSMIGMLQLGEHAVDKGQFIAAKALGYSDTKTFFRIILPQAALHFLPAYADEVTSHIKATAVVGYIAVIDITKVSDLIRGRTYDAFFPLIAVAIMYFILEWILDVIVKLVIRKCTPQNHNMEKTFKEVHFK